MKFESLRSQMDRNKKKQILNIDEEIMLVFGQILSQKVLKFLIFIDYELKPMVKGLILK